MYHFSDSAWAQAAARNRRRERREMLLALLYAVAVCAFFADVWLRGPDSWLGQYMIWAATL